MNVSDPLKPKGRRARSDSPPRAQESESPAPANDAGAFVFGVPLDDESLTLCAKLSCWTATEAAYLTAGCRPPCQPLAIPFFGVDAAWLDEPASYRQTLFERHLLGCEPGTHIAPMDALDLLHRKEEWVHPKMQEAVLHFHAPKRRKRAGTAKPRLGDFMLEDDDEDDERPEALKRKLSTVRRILLGVVIVKLGHNPRLHFNSTPKVIAGLLKDCGLGCHEDTVRRHLKAAKEEHWFDPGA